MELWAVGLARSCVLSTNTTPTLHTTLHTTLHNAGSASSTCLPHDSGGGNAAGAAGVCAGTPSSVAH